MSSVRPDPNRPQRDPQRATVVVTGAFDIAAAEVIGSHQISPLQPVVQLVASATWRVHAQPVDPGWVTLVFRAPLLATDRARKVLGWAPALTGEPA